MDPFLPLWFLKIRVKDPVRSSHFKFSFIRESYISSFYISTMDPSLFDEPVPSASCRQRGLLTLLFFLSLTESTDHLRFRFHSFCVLVVQVSYWLGGIANPSVRGCLRTLKPWCCVGLPSVLEHVWTLAQDEHCLSDDYTMYQFIAYPGVMGLRTIP